MHAIERLRSIARAGEVESTELAGEAAYALAGLADDRAALVGSCRRLLEFHPHVGALWWVCAHLIDALDVRSCAISLVNQLEADASIDELFAYPTSDDRVVIESSRQIVRALYGRVDLTVRLVGDGRSLRLGVRAFGDSIAPVGAYQVNESELALRDATLVVVEALAVSQNGILMNRAGARLARLAEDRGLALVVLAGVGRVLPEDLFGAMLNLGRALHEKDGDRLRGSRQQPGGDFFDGPSGTEEIDAVRDDDGEFVLRNRRVIHVDPAVRYVTPRGVRAAGVVFHPSPSVSHLDCPVPDELLSGFGVTG
ncbi:MAG TPA: hypothetical protein VMU99_00280 [Acidimicrobiales bacterium]|nr:hypothetical protein [Acidimicrobiales bacterium]